MPEKISEPYPVDLEFELSQCLEKTLRNAKLQIPNHLSDSIRYSLMAPGKRIRPRLTLLCAKMFDLPLSAALPAALAIEMIHCFTLIHDDLPCMDNDEFRRGKPTNHKVFGESIALLAGDALIGLAFTTLLEAAPYVKPQALLNAIARLAQATGPAGVTGGQAGELTLQYSPSLDGLYTTFGQKTGALFRAAILMPKDLAAVPFESPQSYSLEYFATELGLAFQMADDLEDAAKEKKLPTNILYYLKTDAIRKNTLERLGKAKKELLKTWLESARPLIAIAEEVTKCFTPIH